MTEKSLPAVDYLKIPDDGEPYLEGHKCENCGELFSQGGCLKTQINKIHEGHKDYKCESCGK